MMFTSWFKKQADRWLAEVITEEAWHLRLLAGADPTERQDSSNALRRFILSVVEEEAEGARAAELRRREEAP